MFGSSSIPQGSDVATHAAGSLLHSQSSNSQRLASSTSLGDHRLHRALSGQAPHPSGTSGGVLGPLTSADNPQELSEQVWGVLLEGLQPFMHWELQSGMGDFWEQVSPPSLHHPHRLPQALLVMKEAAFRNAFL